MIKLTSNFFVKKVIWIPSYNHPRGQKKGGLRYFNDKGGERASPTSHRATSINVPCLPYTFFPFIHDDKRKEGKKCVNMCNFPNPSPVV